MFVAFVLAIQLLSSTAHANDFQQYLQRWIREEKTLECGSAIKEGIFVHERRANSKDAMCTSTVFVPATKVYVLYIDETDCQTVTSPNLTSICQMPSRELRLSAGETTLHHAASESFKMYVTSTTAVPVYCNEYGKDMQSLIGQTLTLHVNGERRCYFRVPPAVRLEFLDYDDPTERKCCSDVLVTSSNINNTLVSAETVSACDIGKKTIYADTVCDAGFIYLRNFGARDRLTFRMIPLRDNPHEKCNLNPVHPPKYKCRKKHELPFE